MLDCLLDFFFPRRSLAGEEGNWVTDREDGALAPRPLILEKPRLRAMNLHFLDRIVAARSYGDSDLLREAIWRFKYRRGRAYGGVLGALLIDTADLLTPLRPSPGPLPLLEEEGIILCPVPLHWTRRFSRGFNQAEILAREVSRGCGLPVRCLLRRKRPTGHQAHRHRKERTTAVRGAFAYRQASDVPFRVVLVDDICTTGATLNACAKTLKKAGVQRVEALVVALG